MKIGSRNWRLSSDPIMHLSKTQAGNCADCVDGKICYFSFRKIAYCQTRHHGCRTASTRIRDGRGTGGFASDRRPEPTRNSRTRDHAIPTGKAKNSGRSAHGRNFQFLDAKINPLLHTAPRPQNGANAHPRRPRDWWLRIRPSARDNTQQPNTGPRNPDRES
jgi:hypothetical protein